ncbi:hypothetical protein [Motiliproteus sediminis]|uniref:hypothetical protein n=1 Tax=Motiliproteus sediminis TaxID=1468178 RepID=UPI001AEFB588|nr:hypothetical protein [Motiliproteus sediminis]
MNLVKTTLATLAISSLSTLALAAESVTVAELHAKRTELAGQQISVTGKVIKVNNGVMRRNFVHVQDDSANATYDRVIFTSQDSTEVGDTVTATGTVKLDTDFGMGYFYPTLVEQASVKPAQ